MNSLINIKKLEQQTTTYLEQLDQDLFYSAHETLEEIWFPLRFEDNKEVRLIRAYINAAVSFELVKRGREKAGLKPWGFYLNNKQLIEYAPKEHLKYYDLIVDKIMQTRTRLNSFQS